MNAYYVRVTRHTTRTYKGPMPKTDAHHYAARYLEHPAACTVDVVHERRVLADIGGRWCLEQHLAAQKALAR